VSRKRPRNLSPEEKQLWSKVTETAKPLGNRVVPAADPDNASKETLFRPKTASVAKPRTLTGMEPPSKPQSRMLHDPPDMDAKLFRKMRGGRLKPEGRIDLHGMTLSEAHPKLIGFIQSAYQSDKRLVLVITGKGKQRDTGDPIPVRTGVLKHHVPMWLGQAPLSPLVLQSSPANQRHGGDGALYVYLRRRRQI